MIGDCTVCITTDKITFNVVLVMTKEDMIRRGHLPNGWSPPPGFWDMDKKIIDAMIDWAYEGTPEAVMDDTWKKLGKIGLPSGGDRKQQRWEAFKALKQDAKLGLTLAGCHDKLATSSDCQKLIKQEWEEWRRIFCGNSRFQATCTFTPAAKAVAKVNGIPVELYEYLGGSIQHLTAKALKDGLVAFARKHRGKCVHDFTYAMEVCTGLKSGKHFGRGGTTIGGVLLTDELPKDPAYRREFMKHEAEHAAQFHHYYSQTKFWPTFLVYYLDQGWDPCSNVYERQADRKGRTYVC